MSKEFIKVVNLEELDKLKNFCNVKVDKDAKDAACIKIDNDCGAWNIFNVYICTLPYTTDVYLFRCKDEMIILQGPFQKYHYTRKFKGVKRIYGVRSISALCSTIYKIDEIDSMP